MLVRQFRLLLPAIFSLALITAATAEEAAVAETISVFGDGNLKIPAGWETVAPQSSIIEHEFAIKSGEAADAPKARVTMMSAGGDIKPNIDRWKGQFTGGDAAAQKTEEKKVGKWTVHIADLSGTFAESMGGGPFAGGKVVQRKDFAMTGIILAHPEGKKYFIKVTGPAEIVKTTRPAVIEMLDGLK